MATVSSGKKEVSVPVIIGVLAVVGIVIAFFAWKAFAPPPEPGAGMTTEQKVKSALEVNKNIAPRSGGILGH